MYIHVVEAEKLLYFVANWSSRNIENVFFLSLFETRQRAKESYRELKRTSKLLYKEWFLYKVRIPISGQLTILQNRFSLKYQQIKNTWTERTKYFPTQKTPTMHLTGWHLLLVSKLSDWLDFWCNNFHPSSRGDEVKGREEHPVWGDGESRRVTADSKPEKHQQFVVLVSVTVRVIIRQCPCTMCERHLAFFCWREIDIGTLARSLTPQPQSATWGRSMWQRKEPLMVKYPYLEDPVWVCCSVPDRCSVLKLIQIKFYPKVQFWSDLWKNGQHTIQVTLDFKEQELASHTAEVP